MSGVGVVEAMFASVEALREGIISLQREIDRLQAENLALKGHVTELQGQVEQAKRYIESCTAAAAEDFRGGRMERILPHDRAAETEAKGGKKKGGL